MRSAYKISVGKPQGTTLLRWENRMEMNLREIGFQYQDRIELAQDKVYTVMDFRCFLKVRT